MAQPNLPIREGGADDGNIERALQVLEQVTSIRVVGEFLKSRSLSFSAGSWADLRDKRIKPALNSGQLHPTELYNLVGELEEYGNSHVFLYRCKKDVASRLLDESLIVSTATKTGVQGRLNSPVVLDQPERPTIAEVRHGGSGSSRYQQHKFLGESTNGNKITREWEIESARAVNVVRLSPSGLLEMRVQSHKNSSRYQGDIKRIWGVVQPFFPISYFDEFSLFKAKGWLWKNRETLKDRLRFSNSTMRNDSGNTVVAATGTAESDLFADDAISKSLHVFMDGGAYCDASNVWWTKQENGIPSADLHVLLSGEDNEFAITANCTRDDYEYVLNQLQSAR